ncbi:MAG TPA: phosphatidylglycerol lysyltransferase domain-containing protein [Acidimicrobiales bacterium]
MTATTHPTEGLGPDGPTPGIESTGFSPEPGATRVEVPLGRRVMVVSDLLLTPEATPTSTAVSTEVARALETWDGPGILIIAGNLFDLTGCDSPASETQRALGAHPTLGGALSRFAGADDRRVIRQTGTHEPGLEADPDILETMKARGVEQLGPVDLHLHTATGVRVVRVEPGEHAYAAGCSGHETEFDPAADAKPGIIGHSSAGRGWHSLAERSAADAAWLVGLNRLSDPSALSRFVVSRTLYRRLGRYAWWLLAPFAVAGLLRVAVTPWVLGHIGSGTAARAIRAAHRADLGDQIVIALLVALVVLGVMALVLGLLSRRMWSILGGGSLEAVQSVAAANDTARDAARRLVGRGYAGLITAATFQSELTHLGIGFYANVGATAEVVEEHRGRLGLPPVFLDNQRVSWVELETGAELHVRMLLARNELRSPSLLERLITRGRSVRSLHPSLVASYPMGESWPAPPDLLLVHRRTRRVRRLASAAILFAGIVDLLDAVTPPLRGRLHVVLEYLPLRASVAAGALIAMAGLALVALGRGILRGQRRAWRVAVALLSGTIILHLIAGADIEESAMALAVLVLLITCRRDFQSASDSSSLRSALIAIGIGVVGMTLLTAVSIELFIHVGPDHHSHIPWWTALWAVSERLVGIKTVPLPHRADRYLAPSLLAIGLSVVAVTLFLFTRPVVDRRLTSGRAAEFRARDIVRRHGTSTLDYFALRSDKKWFFHRDSLVAYAVYGGVCLISPDPIGPRNEREQVWGAFRRFADSHGWVTSVMGAGEDWLSIYRDSGMHNIYLGDEAVVKVQPFTLAGGDMKGLRQAFNRIKKHGYSATFHDPAHLDPALSEELTALMSLSRQGEHERGFSMMLGRVFDPRDTGLLLAVVRDPDGAAAAMCQFVPAPGIHGYSLDLMRRDPGNHPNGLLDFALVSTIEHLRAGGYEGLSLNFAALRSTLSGDKGDGTVQRAERWFLKRLSNFAQIESLWRFNAKYEPEWLPRYVVFDTAEHLVPVVMAILRAESLWEIPVLGRLLAAGAEKRMVAAQRDTEAFIAGFGPWDGNGDAAQGQGPIDEPIDEGIDEGLGARRPSPAVPGPPGSAA